MIPGEIFIKNDYILLNEGRKTEIITVVNTGDRPIQVGSHFHFFETNKALLFDRSKAYGMHLDIPSGTAVRFEPGEEKEVQLVELGGNKFVSGLNGLTEKKTDEASQKEALNTAKKLGFKGVE